MISDAFLLAVSAVVLVQVFFALRFLFTVGARPKAISSGKLPPVSVVVCGRNAEEQFAKNLPYLLKQSYPVFEVVAVNDRSADETQAVLEGFQARYPSLKVVEVKENDRFWAGKKFALTLGIKAATYDHLVFTDADCQPASGQWLQGMASGFRKDKKVVLGVGLLEKGKGFANKVARFETLQTALLYTSFARFGRPYMGVGRNLAYYRSLFYGAGGFGSHMDLASGDDDLFIQQVATHQNTAVVIDPAAFTWSEARATLHDWMQQKRRHLTTSSRYRLSTRLWLGAYSFTAVAWYLLALCLLIPGWYQPLIAGLLGARLLFSLLAFLVGSRRMAGMETLPLFLVLEPFLAFVQFYLLLKNKWTPNPRRWT